MVNIIFKKVNSSSSHFDYVHCGVEILSMSKMIMNRVFDSANDCNVFNCTTKIQTAPI